MLNNRKFISILLISLIIFTGCQGTNIFTGYKELKNENDINKIISNEIEKPVINKIEKPVKNELNLANDFSVILPKAAAFSQVSLDSLHPSFGKKGLSKEDVTQINSKISESFKINELSNLQAVQEKFGVFTQDELKYLEEKKFLIKDFQDTKLVPEISDMNLNIYREFLAFYNKTTGSRDNMYSLYKRKPEDAIFWSADVFFNAYNNLYRELMKEMENKKFIPAMKQISINFYQSAENKIKSSTDVVEKSKWLKVRNYFAIPYAIFSNYSEPWQKFVKTQYGYQRESVDANIISTFEKNDSIADAKENVISFINNLKLDEESTKQIIKDIDHIYNASEKSFPEIFSSEYKAYFEDVNEEFLIAWSLFTPRADYTNSSMRRQYFRAMNWFSQIPFFLKSQDLTADAFAITELMAENPEALKNYAEFESAINFMVGESDDLTPTDYLEALQKSKDSTNKEKSVIEFLINAKNPRIKGMPVNLSSIGGISKDELKLLTKGMRFFSGKFVIDSYWSDYLTQGDEAIQPGYTQKLPPLMSSLQIMNLLGSDYAGKAIPQLDFYKPETKQAIDQAMKELHEKIKNMKTEEWQENLYTGWMNVIRGLFNWQQENLLKLPLFMQNDGWAAKTLMTGSAFWAELRHATLLYAKQSFAELGAGGPETCDLIIPPPAKGYIEPAYSAYIRLYDLAIRTQNGLKERGYDLINKPQLDMFIRVMEKVIDYTKKELSNTEMKEVIKSEVVTPGKDEIKSYQDNGLDINNDGKCTTETLAGPEYGFGWFKTNSDWETIRLAIIDGLELSLPIPIDNEILPAKDKRVSIVADVHTGGDSSTPSQIVYQGVSVPRVIFVAIKDINGARLTTGVVYSHYEFRTSSEGKRLTDEDWQKNFYIGNDDFAPFTYTPHETWPKVNSWYDILFKK